MGLYEGVDGVNKRGLAANIFDAICIHTCGGGCQRGFKLIWAEGNLNYFRVISNSNVCPKSREGHCEG